MTPWLRITPLVQDTFILVQRLSYIDNHFLVVDTFRTGYALKAPPSKNVDFEIKVDANEQPVYMLTAGYKTRDSGRGIDRLKREVQHFDNSYTDTDRAIIEYAAEKWKVKLPKGWKLAASGIFVICLPFKVEIIDFGSAHWPIVHSGRYPAPLVHQCTDRPGPVAEMNVHMLSSATANRPCR